jgi:hypothetical protein
VPSPGPARLTPDDRSSGRAVGELLNYRNVAEWQPVGLRFVLVGWADNLVWHGVDDEHGDLSVGEAAAVGPGGEFLDDVAKVLGAQLGASVNRLLAAARFQARPEAWSPLASVAYVAVTRKHGGSHVGSGVLRPGRDEARFLLDVRLPRGWRPVRAMITARTGPGHQRMMALNRRKAPAQAMLPAKIAAVRTATAGRTAAR